MLAWPYSTDASGGGEDSGAGHKVKQASDPVKGSYQKMGVLNNHKRTIDGVHTLDGLSSDSAVRSSGEVMGDSLSHGGHARRTPCRERGEGKERGGVLMMQQHDRLLTSDWPKRRREDCRA